MTETKPFSENALRRIAQIIERRCEEQQSENDAAGVAKFFDLYAPNVRNIQKFFRRAGFPNERITIDEEEATLWALVRMQSQSDSRNNIIRIIEQLCDPEEYFDDPKSLIEVEEQLNSVLYRYGLKVQFGKVTPVDFGDRLVRASEKFTKDYSKMKKVARNEKSSNEDNKQDVPHNETDIANIERIAKNFHLVAHQLTERYINRGTLIITDEYDVQNLFHSLLKLFFVDIRAEEGTTSYGGKNSRIDFLLKNEQIAIEIKHTRKGLTDKKLTEELILDKEYYSRSHPDCKVFIAFVYDPEKRIRNPRGVENDLSRQINGMLVKVFINQG